MKTPAKINASRDESGKMLIGLDEREHPAPMGRASYIQKAKKENRLARSAYTKAAPQKGATREVQCEHTFKITIPRCAPCGGHDKQCKHYRPKNK